MIIYGFRTRERAVGGGEFVCPCCKFQRSYSEVESKRWFALYFIPIFPVYYQGRHVQCHTCGQSFGLEVIQIASPFHGQAGYGQAVGAPMTGVAAQPLMTHAGAPGFVNPNANASANASGGQPPGKTTHYAYEPPPTSGLGIVSLVLGILSPFFFVACGASIFTALGAVICGHLSLLTKADERGRAPARGSAITGLVLGYLFLLLSPIPIYLAYRIYSADGRGDLQLAQGDPAKDGNTSGSDLLHEMELKVISASDGVFHGNNETAKQLAQEFSDSLLRMRDENFTGGSKKRFKLTGGKFIVCCELRGDSCLFLVHVPEYRNFEKDAKEGLADLAWLCAQETAIKQIGPQGKLAVGLKGVVLYGAVMAGNCEELPAHHDVGEVARKEYLITFLDFVQKREREAIAENANTGTPEPSEPSKSPEPPAVAQSPVNPPEVNPFGSPSSAESPPSKTSQPPAVAEAPANPSDVNPFASPPPAESPPSKSTEPPAVAEAPGNPSDVNPFLSPPAKSPPSGRIGGGIPGGGVTGPGGDSGALMRGSPPGMGGEFTPSGLPEPKVKVLEPIVVSTGNLSARGVTFSPDGKYLAAQVDANIAVFDVKDRKQKATAPWTPELFGVGAMLFSEKSKRLFVGGGSGAVQIWEIQSRGSLQPRVSLAKQEGNISVLAAREDANFVVGGAANGKLFWQQIKSNKPGAIRQVSALQMEVKDIYLPETGLDFWAADGAEVAQVDMKTAEVKSKVRLDGVYGFEVKFSDDGKFLATSFVNDLLILDAGTGQIVHRHRVPEALDGKLEWIPGQNRVLVGVRGAVVLFDAAKGYVTKFAVGDEHQRVDSICATKDGSLIAITSLGGKDIQLISIEKP